MVRAHVTTHTAGVVSLHSRVSKKNTNTTTARTRLTRSSGKWGQCTLLRVFLHPEKKSHLGSCLNDETEVRAVLFELDPTGSQAKKIDCRGFELGVLVVVSH